MYPVPCDHTEHLCVLPHSYIVHVQGSAHTGRGGQPQAPLSLLLPLKVFDHHSQWSKIGMLHQMFVIMAPS